MKKKILLVGLGNIGLRHLEGIISCKNNFTIYLYDKNIKQYELIKKLINSKKRSKHEYFFLNNLNEIKYSDFLIVATNSIKRYDLLKYILKKIKINYLIIEKVSFLNSKTYLKAIKLINSYKIHAWVNCIRREVKFYKLLKNKIKKNHFKITFTGHKWGIASNLIHFIDLFFFFSDSKKIKTNTNFKVKKYKTKRKGFFDIEGKLTIIDNKNNELVLEDNKKYNHNELKINFKDNSFLIKNNKVFHMNNNFKRFQIVNNVNDEKVSVITTRIINKIIQGKKISLSSIKLSYSYHKILFSIINKYLKENKIKKFNYT